MLYERFSDNLVNGIYLLKAYEFYSWYRKSVDPDKPAESNLHYFSAYSGFLCFRRRK